MELADHTVDAISVRPFDCAYPPPESACFTLDLTDLRENPSTGFGNCPNPSLRTPLEPAELLAEMVPAHQVTVAG